MTCAEPGCGERSSPDTATSAAPPRAAVGPRARRRPARAGPGSRRVHARHRARHAARTVRPGRRPRPRPPRRRQSSRYRAIPKGDPVTAIMADPQVPERRGTAATPNATSPSGGRATVSPGSPRASARSAAPDTRSSPSWLPATWSAASTRCRAASPTAASAGSTWRSTATCTTVGGAQGTDELR